MTYHRQKKTTVNSTICGFSFSPSPIHPSTNAPKNSIKAPIKICVGINQDFRRPNLRKYRLSTRGAQSIFTVVCIDRETEIN